MTKHFVMLVMKNGQQLRFPQPDLESSAETLKVFYEALGPIRPIGKWGLAHQDSVAMLYAFHEDDAEKAAEAAKKEVREVHTVEQMIRDFFRMGSKP